MVFGVTGGRAGVFRVSTLFFLLMSACVILLRRLSETFSGSFRIFADFQHWVFYEGANEVGGMVFFFDGFQPTNPSRVVSAVKGAAM